MATGQPWLGRLSPIVLWLAGLKLAIHLWTSGSYNYFRDELYYLACADHLDWGYVDQPPLIAVLTWASGLVLGDSLRAIRFLPAVAGAGKVLLAGLIAKELGGGRYAQGLAALCTLVATVYFGIDNLLSMNAYEPLFWMGCAYLIVRIIRTGDERLWLGFGVLAGLGLENKYSMAMFGFAAVVGLLLTPERKHLFNTWIWLGGLVAFVLFLPNLIWNVQHGWPFVELMRNIKASGRDVELSAGAFFAQQILTMNPITFPVWMGGLVYLLVGRAMKPFRALGWAYVVMLVVLIVLKGKIYYLSPVYPLRFAAGGAAAEQFVRPLWVRGAVAAIVFGVGVLLAPVTLAVLPVETFLRYAAALPFDLPSMEKSHIGAALPQWYADQFGWQEMTVAVARVYNGLSPDERAKTVIYCGNYGEAGAIDFYGGKYGLPKAVSGHQNYFLWGPRGYTGEIAIVLGIPASRARASYEQVEEVARLDHPYALRFEKQPVLLCHHRRQNLTEAWASVKNWN